MKISKKNLQEALNIVKPGLSSKEVVEQSTSFAFMGDRVITYNDEVSISHPIEGLELEGAIHAEELYKMLGKLKKDEIDLSLTEEEIIIKSGKTKAGLRLQSEIRLPLEEIGETGKWKKITGDFLTALNFVKGACSSDMSKPVLTCVNLKKDGTVQSSDGFRIAVFNLEKIAIADELLIPASSINKIVDIKPTQIAEGEGWVHFKNETGTILSCRIFEDRFPDTSRFLDIKGDELNFPEHISDILDTASIFSTGAGNDEKISIELSSGKIVMKGENEYGWLEEKAKVDYEGEDISFNITPYLFRDILKQTTSGILSSTSIKFTGENWEYLALLRK